MGGKISRPQLQRKKSFTTIGRSSQRDLFKKTKLKLNQIEKKLDDTNEDDLKTQLESIEKELGNLSAAIKEKNKDKYENITQQLQETRQKFDRRFKPEVNPVKVTEVVPAEVVEVHNQVPEVEVRKQPLEAYIRPESPKVKFGIQVMPTKPRISQEMLRRTLPENLTAKEEFAEIRSYSLNPSTQRTIIHSTSIIEENGSVKNFSRVISREESLPLNLIEKVSRHIDELEDSMKYFHGTKGDSEYNQLYEKFIQNLISLDNYDVNGNPVLKQDKKILIQRIQDLLTILERLGAPMEAIAIDNPPNDEYKGDSSIGTPI